MSLSITKQFFAIPFICAAISTFALASPSLASDRVAVSSAPLHSLVSSLLAGVDEPSLLFTTQRERQGIVPIHTQLAKIDAAKMVVWVGPTYEPALAGFRAIDPAVSLKGLTLAKTMPLLGHPDPAHPERADGSFDMQFWLDPRLAKVAVGRIAPQLVRLYPDQVERILDNEIELKARLMAMEHHFRHALGSAVGVPLSVPDTDILYLAWRFNLQTPTCPAAAATVENHTATPGAELYFQMMDAVLADLAACQT